MRQVVAGASHPGLRYDEHVVPRAHRSRVQEDQGAAAGERVRQRVAVGGDAGEDTLHQLHGRAYVAVFVIFLERVPAEILDVGRRGFRDLRGGSGNRRATKTRLTVGPCTISEHSRFPTEAMNDLDLSPLVDLLTMLDIPLIPAMFTNKTGNYIEQMANMKRILGRDLFFGLEIMADPRNKSRNVIFLDTPETSSPFPLWVSL